MTISRCHACSGLGSGTCYAMRMRCQSTVFVLRFSNSCPSLSMAERFEVEMDLQRERRHPTNGIPILPRKIRQARECVALRRARPTGNMRAKVKIDGVGTGQNLVGEKVSLCSIRTLFFL